MTDTAISKETVAPTDLEEARRHAGMALSRLEKQGLPLSPENLMLCYAYATGRFPDLIKKIDQIFGSAPAVAKEVWNQTICHFFVSTGHCDDLFTKVGDLSTTVDDVRGHMMEVEGETRSFSETLTAAAGEMEGLADIVSARQMVTDLARQAGEMAARYREMEEKLATSSDEILLVRKAFDQIHHEATTDHATGLATRKYFDARFLELTGEAERVGYDLCLMMIHLDDFPAFVEKHGQRRGDQIVKLFAGIVIGSVRGIDVAATYEKNVFSIILPRTSIKDAGYMADRLRESIGARTLVKRRSGESLGHVTVSIGIAAQHPAQPPEDLKATAVNALADAVELGGNNVIMVRDG